MNATLKEFDLAYSNKEEWARELGIHGFAEKLERERDEAREISEKFRIAFRVACNRLNKTQHLFPWEDSK